jgi:hypothetical protein
LRVFINVDFDDLDLGPKRLGNFFQGRTDHFARSTPFRPEIDNDRRRGFEDIRIE